MFWKILKKSRPMKKQLLCLTFLTLLFSFGSAAQVTFTAQSSTVNCEANSVTIDVVVDNFTNMNAINFTLQWDPSILQYSSHDPNLINVPFVLGVNPSDLANGFSKVSWFSTGSTYPSPTTVFTMTFDLIGNESSTELNFNGPGITELIQNGAPIGPSQYAFNSSTITFTDSTNPVANCPADVTIDAGSAMTAQATNSPPAGTDNCAIDLYNYTLTGATTGSGTGDVSNAVNFNLGTTNVSYTAVDFGGNTNVCSFNVTAESSTSNLGLEVFGEQVNVNCVDNMVSVDILTNNFTDLKGAQFTLNWDASVLQYVNHSNIAFLNGTSFGTNNAANGELTFSWFSSTPTSFTTPDQVLFTLNFSLISPQAGTTEDVLFVTAPTATFIQFVDENNNALPPSDYTISNGQVTILDTSSPTISCPSNVNIDAGTASNIVVNNISPTTSDNCGIASTTYTLTGATTGSGNNDASGLTFNVGTTNVEYTVTDFGGNSVSCTFQVVVDNSGSQLITIEMDNLNLDCNNNAEFCIRVDDFDDIRGVQFTVNWDAAELEYIDTTNVTLNGSNFGVINSGSGVLTYSWFSTTGPVNLPDGESLFCINFNLVNPMGGDSYDIVFADSPTPIQVTTQNSLPNPLSPSDYVIANGTIQISDDNQPPTITCPSNVFMNAGGATSIVVNGLAPTVNDNCSTTVTYNLTGATTGSGNNDASGTTFNLGTTNVEYTVVDFGGNSASCSFQVIVDNNASNLIYVEIDTLDIICSSNNAEVCIRVEDFVDVRGIQFTINWDDTELQYIDTSNVNLNGSNFGVMNSSTGVLTYSWFSAGGPVTLADGESLFCINFNLVNPAGGDTYDINFSNFPTPVQVSTQSSLPNFLPPSEYIIANGSIQLSIDNQPPTISCPANVTMNAGGSSSAIVSGLAPTSTDDCGTPAVTYELTGATTGTGNNDASNLSYNLGVTTVTYTATDGAGNSETCSFTVTISNNPTEFISINIDSLELDCTDKTAEVCIRINNFEDIRGVQFTLNWDPSELNYVDTSNVVLSGSNFGMNNVASGILTYSWFSSGAPVTLPDGESIFCIEFDLVSPVPPASYDITFSNFPTPVQVTTQTSLPNPLPITDYIISNGNIVILSDTQPPSLTCPMDVTVSSGTAPSVAVNGLAPTSSDNCGSHVVTYELTGATTGSGNNDASSLLYNTGVTNVTYTAVDDSGNSIDCSFTVTVETNSANVIDVIIDSLTVNCGDNSTELCIRVNNFVDVRGIQFTLNWDPTEISYNNVSQVVLNNPNFGINNAPNGTMTFSWFSSSAPVTLSDGSAIFCLNFNILNPDPGNDFDINFDFNGSTPFQIITENSLPNTLPPSNYNTLNGNIMIANDTQAPTLDCPDDMTVNSNGAASIVVNNIAPTVSDDCGAPNVTYVLSGATTNNGNTDASGLAFNVGVTNVSYTATDASGNSVNCSFNVSVIQEMLSITCPTNILTGNDIGQCGATITNLELIINSPVSNIASVNYSISGGTTGSGGIIPSHFFDLGTSVVTFTVQDIFGNTANCSFNVSITDSEPPVFSNCPSNITVSSAANCEAAVNWNAPTATDNCGNVTIESNFDSGSVFPGGINVITYTATDIFNNSSTCSFTIEVLDNEPPTIFCPADITVGTDGTITDPNNFLDPSQFQMISCDSVVLGFGLPQGTDNCLNWTIAQTAGLPSGSIFTAGVNTLEFTIYDQGGDSTSCEVNITVQAAGNFSVSGTPDPFCQGSILQLEATLVNSATYNWTGPDNFTSNIHNPTVANLTNSGTYYVSINDNGCTFFDSVQVTVLESPIIVVPSDTIDLSCTGGNQDVTLFATTDSDVTSWQWTDSNGDVVGTDSVLVIQNANASNTGTYTLLATGPNGCEASITQEVIISNGLDMPTITNSCTVGCTDTPCMFFGMFSGSFVDSVVWTSDNANIGLPSDVNTNTITVLPTAGGIYNITFTIYKDGCEVSTTQSFAVNTPALVESDSYDIEFNTSQTLPVTDNDVLPVDYTIDILANVSNGTLTNNLDGTFNYDPNEGFLGTDQFVYQICITCASGPICRFATVDLTVSSGECLVPTIITPNNDGMNDEWVISCAETELQNELIIYNRWGDEVYRAEPYQNDWKGTYNGEDLPDGTYYYIYKTNPSDTEPRKGYITIMR